MRHNIGHSNVYLHPISVMDSVMGQLYHCYGPHWQNVSIAPENLEHV